MKLFLAALTVVALAGASLYYEWTLYRSVMARIEQEHPAPRDMETGALRVARGEE